MPNAFAGQTEPPTQAEVALALGKSQNLWQELVSDLKHDLGLAEQWGSSSIKAGWSLRLQSKKRNIVYLAPGKGSFLASFALGDSDRGSKEEQVPRTSAQDHCGRQTLRGGNSGSH